ncbi:MAG: threonine synthase [Anaerolineales bacterium]|nr:threonine synthase [Anaerolineales bacterium]
MSQNNSALSHLECPECGQTFAAVEPQTYCHDCDSPLLARYELERVAEQVDRTDFSQRSGGMWRWRELLPLFDAACRFSLGEGATPLLRAERLGEQLGMGELFIKDEGVNPTGTFKARGLAMAVSKAMELGIREFVIPTAGNAGGALATYAARADARAHVYMPADAPEIHQSEVRAAGADLHLVDGLIDAAGRQASGAAAENGWFNVATFREPYRVEGKKTMGLELAEAFDWSLPDAIIYPTGGGTGLVGMWKAFQELRELGWLDGDLPRMFSVQAEGCAPVVRAMEQGDERIARWENAETRAAGLRVPSLFADRLVLRALRDSDGGAVAVSEDAIRSAEQDLAHMEGVYACPEGAATLAGLRTLLEQGQIDVSDRTVLFNTGTGLKYA